MSIAAQAPAQAQPSSPSHDLIVGEPGSPVASGADPRFAQYKVIRRNGAVVGFEPAKISIAMTKAFLAINGGQGAASAPVREEVTKLTDAVVAALMKRKPEGGAIHIEEIQDQVELALIRALPGDLSILTPSPANDTDTVAVTQETAQKWNLKTIGDLAAHSAEVKFGAPSEFQSRTEGLPGLKAKYGLERTIKVILDLVTVKFLNSYADKPIYLFGGTGIALIIFSLLVLLFLFIRRIFFLVSVFSSPLFQMSTMILILGVMSILMGLIGASGTHIPRIHRHPHLHGWKNHQH